MISPKQLKYWRKNVKIIYWILFAILNALKTLSVFKTTFLCQKNVHPVLNILTRRGNFVLSFLDFYLFFYECFGGTFKKKNSRRARPGRGPAEPPAHLRVLLREHAGRRRRVRHGHPAAAHLGGTNGRCGGGRNQQRRRARRRPELGRGRGWRSGAREGKLVAATGSWRRVGCGGLLGFELQRLQPRW